MSFIKETEDAKSILKRMSEALLPDQYLERELITQLFLDLQERQTISSAALQVKDSFSLLKEEKVQIVEREKPLLPRFERWCQETSWDRSAERSQVLDTSDKLNTQITRFLSKWDSLAQAVDSVRLELKKLNLSLTGLPQRLEEMDTPLRIQNIQWPKHLCDRVTTSTENASSQIRHMNRLLTKIIDKFEILETVCNNSQSPKKWTSTAGSESDDLEESSDDDC